MWPQLRALERDHGFIFTLLEEAENERMHLIVCMSFFEAGPVTRSVVQLAQLAMTCASLPLDPGPPPPLCADVWGVACADPSSPACT